MSEFKERLLAFAVATSLTLGLFIVEDADQDADLASTSKPTLHIDRFATFNNCAQADVPCR
jgi:hypothetical protein